MIGKGRYGYGSRMVTGDICIWYNSGLGPVVWVMATADVLGSDCSMVIKRPGWESYEWGILLGRWLLAFGLGSALAPGGCFCSSGGQSVLESGGCEVGTALWCLGTSMRAGSKQVAVAKVLHCWS